MAGNGRRCAADTKCRGGCLRAAEGNCSSGFCELHPHHDEWKPGGARQKAYRALRRAIKKAGRRVYPAGTDEEESCRPEH